MNGADHNKTVRHLAHDLNNILTRIVNSVELLKKKLPEDGDSVALLASIENGTYLASEIIEDVITESGSKTPRKKKINLNNLINDLVNSLGIHFKDRIKFEVKLNPKLHFVEGRYTDYYRIVMNLIVNATEAIKESGTITVSTDNLKLSKTEKPQQALFESGYQVQLKIADTGTGIDKSVMPYIFDDQFSTKSKKKNSGIGLTIVKKIIDANNGVIKVSSEKNKGSEFLVRFPAVDFVKHSERRDNVSILVAEDEKMQRELLTELLQSYEYKVKSVENGEELLENLKSYSPDILIIDRNMPLMDGITCIHKIREMNYDIPIILASGSGSEDEDWRRFESIVDKIINKPYNFDEMLGTIRNLLD